MANYRTHFNLMAAVTDMAAAQRYLTVDDMTEYLRDDERVAARADVQHIEWQLDTECTGHIDLYTSRDFTAGELAEVSEWVSGQNSDGLGEGFEQQDFACYYDGGNYYDDPGYDEDEWIMASFDWATNDYTFVKRW